MTPASIVRAIGRLPFSGATVDAIASLVPRRRDALAVLTFHRVAPPDGVVPGLLSATPGQFGAVLDMLRRRFRIVPVDEVLERRAGGPRLAPRSLLLTFDDAYTDIADHAWPALRERGLPALLFVPTTFPGRPDEPFWWERLAAAIAASDRPSIRLAAASDPLPLGSAAERAAAYRRARMLVKELPHGAVGEIVEGLEAELGFGPGGRPRPAPSGRVLDWNALRALAADGLALGSHTRTHPLLTRVAEAAALDDEIAGGRAALARETGSDLAVFAYPSGAVSPAAVAATERAGMRLAFTTRRGVNNLGAGRWLELRRINVGAATPASILHAQAIR